jgi:protein PhnA
MENTYPDGHNYICADCGHEWPIVASESDDNHAETAVKDVVGGDHEVDCKMDAGNFMLKTCYLKKI